jgi:hypothetical protein
MELARAIKGGTLELICPEMELLVCPSYRESALAGAGVIRSDELGRLYFRMVSPFSIKGARHNSLFGSKRLGELYAPEDYVMLRAVDQNGREWRSNQLRIDLSNQIPVPNYLVRSGLTSILYSEKRREIDESYVRILFSGVPKLPFDMLTQNRRFAGEVEIEFSSSFDRHENAIGAASVAFRREEGGFVSVSASKSGAFLPTWPGLMCHALGFSVAQAVMPVVIVREFKDRSDLSLRSGPFWRYSSLMHPPVPFTDPQGTRDFWNLLQLFFLYIEEEQIEPSPLLDELEGIRRGSQGSLQTACLTLAVGIESIAKLLLHDEFSPLVSRPSIEPLLNHLDSWQGDAALKGRARGAVSRLREVGAADLMYAWAKKAGTDKGLVDAWKRLRHPRAHGERVVHESGWIHFCSTCELLHRLIAYAVGYDGAILKTSQPGWGFQQTRTIGQ